MNDVTIIDQFLNTFATYIDSGFGLAVLVGGLSVAVLGATIWSLQPQRRGAGEQTELYNVDRVSKSEGLDGLPADY